MNADSKCRNTKKTEVGTVLCVNPACLTCAPGRMIALATGHLPAVVSPLQAAQAAQSMTAEQRATAKTGLRFNEGKLRLELLDPIALEGMTKVLEYGSRKYSDNNWKKGMSWQSVLGCLLRHTFKFMAGEDLDPETKLPHVDHILCNAMFLSNFYRMHKNQDDRYKPVTNTDPKET